MSSTAAIAEREKGGKIWYSWKAFAPTLADWTAETRRRLFVVGLQQRRRLGAAAARR